MNGIIKYLHLWCLNGIVVPFNHCGHKLCQRLGGVSLDFLIVFSEINVGLENDLVSYSAADEHAGRPPLKGPGLLGADLDIFRFELAGLVTSAVWVDMSFDNFQFAVVKRLARRLCLSGHGIGDGVLHLLDIGFEGSPLLPLISLWSNSRSWAGSKGRCFSDVCPNTLLRSRVDSSLSLAMTSSLSDTCFLRVTTSSIRAVISASVIISFHLVFLHVKLVKINDTHKLMAAFLRYFRSFFNSFRHCRRPSFFSTIPSTISTRSLHSIVSASSSLLDMVGCPKVPASSSLE